MYSESDLEARGRGGRDQRRSRRASATTSRPGGSAGGGRRAFPAAHRLQRHLRRDRGGDPAGRGRLDRQCRSPPHIDGDGPSPFAGLFVAGTAWGLAEFFTRQRRMALPSIMLLLAFVGGVFAAGVRARSRSALARPTSSNNEPRRGAGRRGRGGRRGRRRLAALAALHGADHGRGRRGGGSSGSCWR